MTTVETLLVEAIRDQIFHPSTLEYVMTIVKHRIQTFTQAQISQKGKIEADLQRVEQELRNIEQAILSGVIGKTTANLLKEREALQRTLQSQLADIEKNEPARDLPIDSEIIKERFYSLLETLKQDTTRINTFFRTHLSPISCTPIQNKKRRYYRACGASKPENLMKSLGLDRKFAIGGCGGGI